MRNYIQSFVHDPHFYYLINFEEVIPRFYMLYYKLSIFKSTTTPYSVTRCERDKQLKQMFEYLHDDNSSIVKVVTNITMHIEARIYNIKKS